MKFSMRKCTGSFTIAIRFAARRISANASFVSSSDRSSSVRPFLRRDSPRSIHAAYSGLARKASCAAALYRISITPIDTVKTLLQVQGPSGMAVLSERVAKHGVKACAASAKVALTCVHSCGGCPKPDASQLM